MTATTRTSIRIAAAGFCVGAAAGLTGQWMMTVLMVSLITGMVTVYWRWQREKGGR